MPGKQKIGWIGMGRMGYPMAERLLKAGYDVSIWNRTRSKAEPLAKAGNTDAAGVEREFFKTMRPGSLLKRFATPEEIAAMVTFVASPLSAATNGAALRVDGGVVHSIV